MNLLTIVGARPQFIKAAAVHRELSERYVLSVRESYLHTGQHYDAGMNDVFFRELDLPVPVLSLGVGSGTPAYQIGTMMQGIEDHLRRERPDAVLVYGDTNSTLAGALAASREGVPVLHIEAGLRSGDLRMQEESNRVLTDHVSTLLFAPTRAAVANLEREGFGAGRPERLEFGSRLVIHGGDVMLDNLLYYRSRARQPAQLSDPAVAFALATFHRAEVINDSSALAELVRALRAFARETGMSVVVPLHPATRKQLAWSTGEVTGAKNDGNIRMLDPVSYLEMLWLLDRAEYVLTDSGGLQKEACFLGKKCLVLRDVTEWTELVDEQLCVLAGTTTESILQAIDRVQPGAPERAQGIFGAGRAAKTICEAVVAAMHA